jgi:hypothetical protein
MIGDAKQTTNTDRTIYKELTRFLSRTNNPTLQHVVPEPDRKVEVVEKVRQTGADFLWHNVFVSVRYRLDRVDRERVVQPECGVIKTLPRIVDFLNRFVGEFIS